MESFLQNSPKVELHAHLNGSLNTDSIKELGKALYGENTTEFLDLAKEFTNFNGLNLNECFKKFGFVHNLTATKAGLAMATQLAIRDFHKDNVVYLELRTTPKANVHMSRREYLECVLSAIKEAQMQYPTIRVKLLPSIDRSQAIEIAEETVNVTLQLQEQYPDMLPGIDLSGNPNCGEFQNFASVLRKARQNGLKLALHCAETDNPKEVAEMVEFGMERCGHGTFLTEVQLRELGDRNVAIECCLTSNVKCGTVPSYDDHHFQHIFAARNAVVLCTDDSGVFDTTLTQEFLHADRTYGLKKQDYKELTLHAVEHAFTNEIEKNELRSIVEAYF